jgi:glycerophosphoryl diester phosphodiesterase
MTLIYGHRGARGEAPENTLASFQRCLKQGVTRCELDLHLSRDGQLMVIHDPTLKRTTGRHGKVFEQDAADLVRLDARAAGPGWPQPCPIPTLAELFEKCPFEHWQLEVKSASRVRAARMVLAIEQLVAHYGLHGRVIVTSSSREVLRALQRLAPGLPRGLVAEHAWLDPIKVANNYGCSMLVLNWILCSPERLLRAQRQGLHVSVWTVNEPALMLRLADFGADSLITDFPVWPARLWVKGADMFSGRIRRAPGVPQKSRLRPSNAATR